MTTSHLGREPILGAHPMVSGGLAGIAELMPSHGAPGRHDLAPMTDASEAPFDRDRLQAWASERLGDRRSVEIGDIARVSTGNSNDTFVLSIRAGGRDAAHGDRPLVLRLTPSRPGLLEPYDVVRQYRIMDGLAGTPVPVPHVIGVEESDSVLGRPFFVMEHVEGETFETAAEWVTVGPERVRRMHENLIRTLAGLHDVDWHATGLHFLDHGDDHLGQEVARWAGEVRQARLAPLPAIDDVLVWLDANRPEPSAGTPRVAHGDFKWGNVLFRDDEVVALLDWELTHLGDPLEDLAYYFSTSAFAGGLHSIPGALDRDETLAYYEDLRGVTIDREVFRWHEALQLLKITAIFLRGLSLFERGASDDLRFALMAGALPNSVGLARSTCGLEPNAEVGMNRVSLTRAATVAADVLAQDVLPEVSAAGVQGHVAMAAALLRMSLTPTGTNSPESR